MSDHDVRAALRVLERCGLSGLSTESLQGLRDAVEQERVRRMRGGAAIVRMHSTWVRMDSGEVVETGSSVEVSDLQTPPALR